MDHFFQYESLEEMSWFNEPILAYQSAFRSYREPPIGAFPRPNHLNIHKRMIELSKTRWAEANKPETEQSNRHMIGERRRRAKQRQSYLTLHSMMPPQTKNDKNTILQMAAKKVEELQRSKEELQRRNKELEDAVLAGRGGGEGAKMKLRVDYPSSGIDSMLEVLKCLKKNGSKVRSIQSNISAQELSAVIEIDTKIGAEKVEEAVLSTLFEVERKIRLHFP